MGMGLMGYMVEIWREQGSNIEELGKKGYIW